MEEKQSSDPVQRRADARIGQWVRGKMHLDALLGIGGMAAVYAATHRNGSRVAIKILHEHLSRDTDARRRFRQEAIVANRVEHGAILRVLDDDVADDGSAYLVLPLLVGETLQARLKRLGARLTARETVTIGYVVLDALAVAHGQGIIHRDIKPENLFITSEGEIRILDFGVARLVDQAGTDGATLAGHAVGTPAFMSPEQALGRAHLVDGQSDLWAVGATLFTCLSGSYVHGSRSASELLIYAGTKPAPALLSIEPAVEEHLAAVIDRALAREKSERWPTAAAMRDALAAVASTMFTGQLRESPRVAPAPSGSVITFVQTDVHSVATQSPALAISAGQSRLRKPDRYKFRNWLLTSLIAAMAGIGVAGVTLRKTHIAERNVSDRASSPSTASEETDAAFAAWRDATLGTARVHLKKAFADDQDFARANLLQSILDQWIAYGTRAAFQRAWDNQSHLDERERALVHALQPAMAIKPELDVSLAKLLDASRTYPDFDVASYAVAETQMRLGLLGDAESTMTAFLQHDDHFALGWRTLGMAQILANKPAAARSSFMRCLSVTPYATSCLHDLVTLDENEGDCAEAEAMARTWATAEPSSSRALRSLGRAVYGRGGSIESTREIFARGTALVADPIERHFDELDTALVIELLRGDFSSANRDAARAEQAIATSTDEELHAELAETMVGLNLELRDFASAIRTAEEFASRRDAWDKDDYFDYSIFLSSVKYRAGAIRNDQFALDRDRWLQAQASKKNLVATRGTDWITAYAIPTMTHRDATEALRKLADYLPMLDPMTRSVDDDDAIGSVYLLAGKYSEARPFLERAAHSCHAARLPIAHTLANFHFGAVLEALDDIEGACAAYSVVMSRWGKEPRSATASEARRSLARLGCAGK